MEIPSDSYKRFIADHHKVKKMNTVGFVTWVKAIWQDGYSNGRQSAIDEIMEEHNSVIVPENIEAEVIDTDELMNAMLAVKGIGPNRARQVIEILCGKE